MQDPHALPLCFTSSFSLLNHLSRTLTHAPSPRPRTHHHPQTSIPSSLTCPRPPPFWHFLIHAPCTPSPTQGRTPMFSHLCPVPVCQPIPHPHFLHTLTQITNPLNILTPLLCACLFTLPSSTPSAHHHPHNKPCQRSHTPVLCLSTWPLVQYWFCFTLRFSSLQVVLFVPVNVMMKHKTIKWVTPADTDWMLYRSSSKY